VRRLLHWDFAEGSILGSGCRNRHARGKMALKAALEKGKAKKDALKAAGAPLGIGLASRMAKTAMDAAKSRNETYDARKAKVEAKALFAEAKKCIKAKGRVARNTE
jgi:hypothetical protein